VKALAEIEHRSRRRGKPVDSVIIETTGLADPAPVAFTFFANPWIASRYKLDSIMCARPLASSFRSSQLTLPVLARSCLVDAKHLIQVCNKRSLVVSQRAAVTRCPVPCSTWRTNAPTPTS
jgi:hypothetical protein